MKVKEDGHLYGNINIFHPSWLNLLMGQAVQVLCFDIGVDWQM